MKQHNIARLGDHVNVKTGKLDVNAGSPDGIYPFFTCAKEEYRINSYSFDCECVLLAGNGDLNIKYYNGKFNAYQRTYVIESKDKNLLDVRYLYFFMSMYIGTLRDVSIGGVIKYIKLGDITDAKIPLPPLPEQRRIAETLDRAQRLIDLRKKQIEEMDRLVQAVFVEMFGDPVRNEKGWEKTALADHIEFLTSGSRGWAQHYSNEGSFFITIKNVKNGKIVREDVQHVIAPQTQEARRTKVQENDLLISITADLGRTAVVDRRTAEEEAYINQHLSLVRLKKSMNPAFTSSFLESKAGKLQFAAKNQVGVKAGLNFEAIMSLMVLLPPIQVQNEYSQLLEQINEKKATMETGLVNLEQNSRVLMQMLV